jgi:hypothetical protein
LLGCDEASAEQTLDALVDSHLLELTRTDGQGTVYRWTALVRVFGPECPVGPGTTAVPGVPAGTWRRVVPWDELGKKQVKRSS